MPTADAIWDHEELTRRVGRVARPSQPEKASWRAFLKELADAWHREVPASSTEQLPQPPRMMDLDSSTEVLRLAAAERQRSGSTATQLEATVVRPDFELHFSTSNMPLVERKTRASALALQAITERLGHDILQTVQGDVGLAVRLAMDLEGTSRARRLALELGRVLVSLGAGPVGRVLWSATLPRPHERPDPSPLHPVVELCVLAHRAHGSSHRVTQQVSRAMKAIGRAAAVQEGPDRAVAIAAFKRDVGDALAWSMASSEGLAMASNEAPATIRGRLFSELENPFPALLALWETGYVLGAINPPAATILLTGEAPYWLPSPIL